MVREMVLDGQFIEVYLNAPPAVCEQRDPKGIHAKARAGEIKEFAGVSASYETPLSPELELQTDKMTVGEAVAKILEYLHVGEEDTEISI